MAIGKVKLAEDQYRNKMQLAHVDTASFVNIAALGKQVWDSTSDRIVRIIPTTGEAWIGIKAATFTPAADEGMYINAEYHTVIRKNEWIGSSAIINVVNVSEL